MDKLNIKCIWKTVVKKKQLSFFKIVFRMPLAFNISLCTYKVYFAEVQLNVKYNAYIQFIYCVYLPNLIKQCARHIVKRYC